LYNASQQSEQVAKSLGQLLSFSSINKITHISRTASLEYLS